MSEYLKRALSVMILGIALSGCAPGSGPAEDDLSPTPAAPTSTSEVETSVPVTPEPPSPTPTPQGRTILVTGAGDSGPGTLRQALLDAGPGDTIIFDDEAFPPDSPVAIMVQTELPHIHVDHLTIDASDAGVVLDGSPNSEGWMAGLQLVSSHGTIVRGLRIESFSGPGIALSGGASGSVIGGDPTVGMGPSGQGNVLARNAIGVDISTEETSNNQILGNSIGTDVAGNPDLGNHGSGISISEGASGNTVGPDNIITASGRCGIEVMGEGSDKNLFSQNRIHDNRAGGICLLFGANGGMIAPLIVSTDWQAGMVNGIACSGCTLEIFSDDGDEGATYEGQAIPDSKGWFTFDKGRSFTKSNVTLIATSPDGNSSEFARSTSADSDPLTLQSANPEAPTILVPLPSGDLEDNNIATNVVGPQLWLEIEYAHEYLRANMLDLGVTRINTSLNEVEPPITWEASEFEIPPEYDQLIDEMVQNNVEVNYMLHFWDKEGHANGEVLSKPRFRQPEQIEDFLDYVRFIVRHFRGRVRFYTLWTEPDNCHQGGGIKCIRASDYIELAQQVIPVIHEEDAEAKVSVAPIVLFYERGFLPAVLSSDAGPMFDVVQWHGQYDVRPDNQYYGSYYYDYASIVEGIQEAGAENGFHGEYWSTDMSWVSEKFHHEAPGDQPWVDFRGSDKLAAKYCARGILRHLGMGISAGLENGQPGAIWPWSYPTVQQLSTIMAGATPVNLHAEISGEPAEARIVSYAFELPDGDILFALWNDNTAVESDPGTPLRVAFPDQSISRVVGLDVLLGFEQELIPANESGGLVLRDLLVKDYPIILRLVP